jgi:hypothetical protein
MAEHLTSSRRQEPAVSGSSRTASATENAPYMESTHQNLSPDLQSVVDVWDRLPEAVRAGIVAMVKASSGESG